jgi:hypothetical protein
MISNYSKGFSMGKNGSNLPNFIFKKNPKSPESYDNFQKAAKNLEGFCYISSLHIY